MAGVDVTTVTNLLSGGAGGILVAGVYQSLILTGKLLVAGSHEEVLAVKDAVISAKDLIIADKDKQIALLTEAVRQERERADAGVLAAQVTRDVMSGLRRAVQ